MRVAGLLSLTDTVASAECATLYQGPVFRAWEASPELPAEGASRSEKPMRSETPAESPPKLLGPCEADTPVSAPYSDSACRQLTPSDRVMKRLIPRFSAARLQCRCDASTTLSRSVVGQPIPVKASQHAWNPLCGPVLPAGGPLASGFALNYAVPVGPGVGVKWREGFGWATRPCIGDGRVSLTLQLLSPAQRPVQVTRDLAGFWRSSYFEVRKELRGRYPRHPWSAGPPTAEATRRAKPRGS